MVAQGREGGRDGVVTLRGLRVPRGRLAPSRWRGEVVPWERVRLAGRRAFPCDDRGRPLRSRLLPLGVDLTVAQAKTATRAQGRAILRAFDEGCYDVTDRYRPWGDRAMGLGLTASSAFVLGWCTRALLNGVEWADGIPGEPWVRLAVFIVLGGTALSGVVLLVLGQEAMRRNVRMTRLTSAAIEITVGRGRAKTWAWSGLTRIERRRNGWRLRLAAGETVLCPCGGRKDALLRALRSRLDPGWEERARREDRAVLLRAAIMCQGAGVLALVLSINLGTPGREAWGAYAFLGALCPVVLGLVMLAGALQSRKRRKRPAIRGSGQPPRA